MSQERRRRWSAEEKAALVRETYEPGMNVSLVARQHDIGGARAAAAGVAGSAVPVDDHLASLRIEVPNLIVDIISW